MAENIFSILSSGQRYFLNGIRKLGQKLLVIKSKLSEKKPLEHKYIVTCITIIGKMRQLMYLILGYMRSISLLYFTQWYQKF